MAIENIQQRDAGFPGATERARCAFGIEFVESCYTQPVRMGLHAHPTPFFHLVLAGRVSDRTEKHEHRGSVATFNFFPAGMPHQTNWEGGGAGIAMMLDEVKAAQWAQWNLLPENILRQHGGLISALLYVAFRRAFDSDVSECMESEALLCAAVTEIQRTPRLSTNHEGASRRLWRAREILYETPLENLSLTDLATQIEVHPVYLSRAFHQAFGETVSDCLRRRRIDESCHRIRATAEDLTQIAFATGFSDQAHFSRVFRHYLGMPPSEYARMVRSQNSK
jgi:AraC family transcriptional regulator